MRKQSSNVNSFKRYLEAIDAFKKTTYEPLDIYRFITRYLDHAFNEYMASLERDEYKNDVNWISEVWHVIAEMYTEREKFIDLAKIRYRDKIVSLPANTEIALHMIYTTVKSDQEVNIGIGVKEQQDDRID